MPPARIWWRYALYPPACALFLAAAVICVAIVLLLDPIATPKQGPQRWD